jgi:futalosine hydrolase
MKVLLVSATEFEVRPFLERVGSDGGSLPDGVPRAVVSRGQGNASLDCLVTGVGQLQCGVHLTHCLIHKEAMHQQYSLVLQAGLGGSFTDRFPKRCVVRVISEALGDLGAEDNGGFLDLFQMGFLKLDSPPFSGVSLDCPWFDAGPVLGNLPTAKSITVNRVLGEQRSIDWVCERYNPDVVNMEGAAAFYACSTVKVPCVSLRAISDMVGPRNKAAWDVSGAVTALNEVLGDWWDRLSGSGLNTLDPD